MNSWQLSLLLGDGFAFGHGRTAKIDLFLSPVLSCFQLFTRSSTEFACTIWHPHGMLSTLLTDNMLFTYQCPKGKPGNTTP
jgi:hypothetical protein